ncbi:aldo/keto reductase [Candidatus Obscuribacterales bacterium]|nr:aldo/keto reductase [Candidatus Obscuribacterales bacterium]
MQVRQLGDSDVQVSAIIFGAWAIGGWMWGGAEETDAIEAIHASIEGGATSIDTAAIYGYGRSEEIVGKAIKGKRDKVQILTKFGLRWDSTEGQHFFDWDDEENGAKTIYRNARKKSIIHECEQSLKRLGTDYIDLYQCHWRDSSTPVEETMEALNQLLKDGKIKAAGVSNFTVEDMERARKVCPIASDQPPYSMVLRDIEKDVLPYCRKENIGVIVYSPLQRGLLTGKFKPDAKFKEGDHRANEKHFQPENIKRVNAFLENIKPIAESHNVTLGQLVIAWTIAQPGVTSAIVGARDAQQCKENLIADRVKLSKEEVEQINKHLESLKLEPAAAK